MTMPMAGKRRDAAGWIGLAGSPTFGLMAWIAATDTPRITICASASHMLPIDGMAWMYLLMSLSHMSPWLKLAAARPWKVTNPSPQPKETDRAAPHRFA
jgi:hypothetical protein